MIDGITLKEGMTPTLKNSYYREKPFLSLLTESSSINIERDQRAQSFKMKEL